MSASDDDGGAERAQDPYVERLRPDPSQPPRAVLTLAGLLGDSDRPGFRRLYFTRELDYYAEFRADDMVDAAPISAEEPPFLGDEATRVRIRRDAMIEYTRTRMARPVDEFDLDVRLGAAQARAGAAPDSFVATCWVTCPLGCIEVPGDTGDTCFCGRDTVQITICRGRTCVDVGTCDTCGIRCRTDFGQTCDTCAGTCDTCQTQCGQNTCAGTCNTCQTNCGQNTCNTCQTNCGQATCNTCHTDCGQVTCNTCHTDCGRCLTDNPHVFTCGPQC